MEGALAVYLESDFDLWRVLVTHCSRSRHLGGNINHPIGCCQWKTRKQPSLLRRAIGRKANIPAIENLRPWPSYRTVGSRTDLLVLSCLVQNRSIYFACLNASMAVSHQLLVVPNSSRRGSPKIMEFSILAGQGGLTDRR